MDTHRILVIHAPPHTLLLQKKKQKQWAAVRCEHACALYRCPSVCQYAWAAYGDHFRHVGQGSRVDMYRILAIRAPARAMWIRSTGSRIVCLWIGGSMDAPCIRYKCVSDGQYVWGAYAEPYLHVGCAFNMDMYRILIIQTSPCTLLIAFRVQKASRPRMF